MKGEFVMLFHSKEKGQGLVEYALIIVLIAIVVIVAMQFLAPTIGNVFTEIANTLTGV
jgi:pilus assembly protein Flp/PilA